MHGDLVPLISQGRCSSGYSRRGHARDEERRWHVMPAQHIADARNPDPAAVGAPAQPCQRPSAIAQFVGFMIGVERERDGHARSSPPTGRPQGPARPDAAGERLPMRVVPLPGLLLCHDFIRVGPRLTPPSRFASTYSLDQRRTSAHPHGRGLPARLSPRDLYSSARWQAAAWPSRTRSAGGSVRQRSNAFGQRG